MALARSWAISLVGVTGHLVEVEADLANGLPGLSITGLPDASLAESRDRVRAAVVNSGHTWPQRRVTLGLSPATLPKRGSGFDLALAAAVLAAEGEVPEKALARVVLIGELGLDGRVRPVPGVLPSVVAASRAGFDRVIVPLANLAEAQLLPGVQARGVGSLRALVALLRGQPIAEDAPVVETDPLPPQLDLLDVAGQALGRNALEVAAAGGHHLLLLGSPGCGKTMLAERMPGILPPLSLEESLEVTAIHSVAGLLGDRPLIERPPFQAPHHGATTAALIGGGSGLARPGAISLAHRGTLFLDEAPEFRNGALDALRQPLESGHVSIRRVGGTADYPARFSLVMAANPCPCARAVSRCSCPPERVRQYRARLSGPLLDRIDLQVDLPDITRSEVLAEGGVGEASETIAVRVAQARRAAAERYAGTPWRTNADVPPTELRRRWPIERQELVVVGKALDEGTLTARGFGRVLRVAWTIADLCGDDRPRQGHVDHALGLRLGAPRAGVAA